MSASCTCPRPALRSVPGAALAAGLALLAPRAQDAAPEPHPPDAVLDRLLAEAVDRPTPAARTAAAAELAALDVTVARWLEACARFMPRGPRHPLENGRVVVPLQVGSAVEETTVHVHEPAGLDPDQPAPLMLSMHGTGGSGAGMERMWAGVADRLGMIVVAPSESGENVGYRFSDRERAVHLAVLRWARRRWNVDEDRVFAAGISRGGHLAWDLALRWPDRFAAIAPMIGGPRLNIAAGQNNLRYLDNVLHLPIRDLQGLQDDPRLVFNVQLAFEQLAERGAVDARLLAFEDRGHSFDFAAVDWPAFLGAARRDPVPATVRRAAADPAEARAFWLELTRLDRDVAVEFRPEVRAREWERLDDAGRRRFLQRAADERTAVVEAEYTGPGRFDVTGRGCREIRLLLTAEMLPEDGRVRARVFGKTRSKVLSPRSLVLLEEFVERFDRRFLPVASWRVQ